MAMKMTSISELEFFLNSINKKRNWIHMLSSRYNLIPKPIIKPNIITNCKTLKKTVRGRLVAYPEGTIKHICMIILLHKDEGLTYEQISKRPEIEEGLNCLNLKGKLWTYL